MLAATDLQQDPKQKRRFQVMPGFRPQERPSTLESETPDPALAVSQDDLKSALGGQEAADQSRRFSAAQGGAAPPQPSQNAQPQPIGTTPSPKSLQVQPGAAPAQADNADFGDPKILDNIQSALAGAPKTKPYSIAINPPTPQFSAVPSKLDSKAQDSQNDTSSVPQGSAPTPSPAAANGPVSGTETDDFIRRFNTKTDEMGKTEQEFEDSSKRLNALGDQKATPMPVSGWRRFGGIAAGILAGVRSKDPFKGIQEAQAVEHAPELRRNQLIDYQMENEKNTNAALKDKLQAQKDILSSYGTGAKDLLELQKFNAPDVHYEADPTSGITYKVTTDKKTGALLGKEQVAGGEHGTQVQINDPAILKNHPEYQKGQYVPATTFRELLQESRTPTSQGIQPIFNQGVLVGMRRGADTWGATDETMPPEVRKVADDAEKSTQTKIDQQIATKKQLEQATQDMIFDRQKRMAQIETDLKNHQAPGPFKDRLTSAYMDLDQIKNIRQIVAQKPYLVGPVAGRLQKTGMALGTSFGLQNPADEQDAARLEGYIAYLFANELKASVSGRPNKDLQKDLQDASAKISQEPNMMEGFLKSAETNAHQVIGMGKDKWHIDLEAPRLVDQQRPGAPQAAPATPGAHPLDQFWHPKK